MAHGEFIASIIGSIISSSQHPMETFIIVMNTWEDCVMEEHLYISQYIC